MYYFYFLFLTIVLQTSLFGRCRERGDGGGGVSQGGGWVLSNRSISDPLSLPGQSLGTIYQQHRDAVARLKQVLMA